MRTVRRFPLRIRSVLCADTQAGAGVSPVATEPKIGFILRRTVGSAVMRNRFKRVFRHQLGRTLAQLPPDAWQQRAVYVVTWEGPKPLTETAIRAANEVWSQWLDRAVVPVPPAPI